MQPKPNPGEPKIRDDVWTPPPEPYTVAEPVAEPAPSPDSKKAIPKGDLEVEKFNVNADTGGGD